MLDRVCVGMPAYERIRAYCLNCAETLAGGKR